MRIWDRVPYYISGVCWNIVCINPPIDHVVNHNGTSKIGETSNDEGNTFYQSSLWEAVQKPLR